MVRMPSPVGSLRAGDGPRTALIGAALDLFGRQGFEATSTRGLAKAAKVNIASIAYHFGSKEGLRTACARHIGETLRTVVAGRMPDQAAALNLDRDAAESVLVGAARALLQFVVARPESESIARFAIREQMNPSPAFDVLFEEFLAPIHERLCAIWAKAAGTEADSVQTRLRVFILIGQIVYFRLARVAVLRRMNWREADAAQHIEDIAREIEAVLHASLQEVRRAG